ncbi:MAG TPA: helix-turn-helix domain-containing protein [Bryobacteraceae bacterium]|nr:helix-turn-helix domain-containing protein [Bryobacteraceae bacterium]
MFDHWLTKKQAAAALATSERTIERMAAAGKLTTRPRERPGKKPEPVYPPDEVDALKQTITPTVELIPQPALPPPKPLDQVTGILELMARAIARHDGRQWKPWLSIEEAAEYSGISQTRIRRLAHEGRIRFVRDGMLKVFRQDLDNADTIAPIAAKDGGIGKKRGK